MTAKFELNGKTYKTDENTIKILRTIVAKAKETKDTSALQTMMILGEMTKTIVEA